MKAGIVIEPATVHNASKTDTNLNFIFLFSFLSVSFIIAEMSRNPVIYLKLYTLKKSFTMEIFENRKRRQFFLPYAGISDVLRTQ